MGLSSAHWEDFVAVGSAAVLRVLGTDLAVWNADQQNRPPEHPPPDWCRLAFWLQNQKGAIEQHATQIRDAGHAKKVGATYAETSPQREQIIRDHG